MRAPGQVFTREQLADRLAEVGYSGLERTLNVHIRNLRSKIEPDPDQPRYIETVFGVGYRLHRPEADHDRRVITRSLAGKLTLAFLLVALTTALLVAVFIRLTNASQLDHLIVEQQRSEFQTTLVDVLRDQRFVARRVAGGQEQRRRPQGTPSPAAGRLGGGG